MRIALAFLIALTMLPCAVAGEPTTPSDESLRQLFEAAHMTRILDTYLSTVDEGMQVGLREALAGEKPNARQQQIIDDMRAQIIAAMRDTLDWKKLEPLFLDVYRRTFTQEEVNDLLAFYRSPSGRSVVDKLPTAMQQAGQAVQGMMPAFIHRVQEIRDDAIRRLKAAGGK
jgi:hypothetical protein